MTPSPGLWSRLQSNYSAVKCYRRRPTPVSKTILVPYTMCRRAINDSNNNKWLKNFDKRPHRRFVTPRGANGFVRPQPPSNRPTCFLGPHESPLKWHLDRFSRFCRAHPCDQQTDTDTWRLLYQARMLCVWCVLNNTMNWNTFSSECKMFVKTCGNLKDILLEDSSS